MNHGRCCPGGIPERGTVKRRLRLAIGITLCILVVEGAGGIYSNSLALLSDAGHMLTDAGALILSYAAIALAQRPASTRKTWGWYRIEILAALANGALLCALAGGVIVESFARLRHPEPVRAGPLSAVAAFGLVANIVAMLVLAGGRRNLNIRGALLHVIGDTLSSVGVLGAGLVMMATGWEGPDSVMGMVISVVIVISALRLLKEAVDVLLEGTPAGIELEEVASSIGSVKGVRGVHDLHIWSITSGMPALSGHVILEEAARVAGDETLNSIKRMLHDRYAIVHTTLQIESASYEEYGEVH